MHSQSNETSKTMTKRLCVSKNRVSWSWVDCWPRLDKLLVNIFNQWLIMAHLVYTYINVSDVFESHYSVSCHFSRGQYLLPIYWYVAELGGLLKYVRPFLNSISKAKAARLVRSLLDMFLDMEAATGQEVELCLECIEWAKSEKRTFLRQTLEVSTPSFVNQRLQQTSPLMLLYVVFSEGALWNLFDLC